MVSGLKEIFTTLVNECKEDKESFKVVHVKRGNGEVIDLVINPRSSVESLSEKVMAKINDSTLLEVKRYGTTQVVIKIS